MGFSLNVEQSVEAPSTAQSLNVPTTLAYSCPERASATLSLSSCDNRARLQSPRPRYEFEVFQELVERLKRKQRASVVLSRGCLAGR